MKGDFSRDTFDASKHFSRVLMQQGRVTLDADYNEHNAVVLRQVRTAMRDLIGPFGAPRVGGGFQVTAAAHRGLCISPGRYYVDGILVENEVACRYDAQPHGPLPSHDLLASGTPESAGTAVVYLDVWERHVTALDDPSLREVALGGPDTASRAQVVWQVRSVPLPARGASIDDAIHGVQRTGSPTMAAAADPYTGLGNQLYRVEVHRGGNAGEATFKWSRDNGSVVTERVAGRDGAVRVLDPTRFAPGDWVELIDDASELQGAPGALVRVARVDETVLVVQPACDAPAWNQALHHPKVRRWDHDAEVGLRAGAVPLHEDTWIGLEHGISVRFAPGEYRTGDYWLIPARVETCGIEWPKSVSGEPLWQAPRGIVHRYAPLAVVTWDSGGAQVRTCRSEFDTIARRAAT